MGKSIISTGQFSLATLNYQRVKHVKRATFSTWPFQRHPHRDAPHGVSRLEYVGTNPTTHGEGPPETGHSIGKWDTYEKHIYDIWEDVALWDTISMVSDSKNIQKPWYKMRSTYRPAGWQVKPAIDDGSGPPSNTHPVHINIVHGQLHGRHPGTWQRPNLDCRYFMIHHRNSLDTSDKPYNAWTLCLYDMNRIVMRRFGTDPKTNLQNYCEPRVGPTSITSPCFLSMNCARAKTLINDNHRIVFPERPGKSNYSRVSKASITTCSENTIVKTWGHNDELPERPSKLWFKF